MRVETDQARQSNRRSEGASTVKIVDKRSAPRILWSGEDLRLERLPAGSRVIYPNPPLRALTDLPAAVRYAVTRPLDSDPLPARLRPGMRVAIAVDDISIPLPKMATPDARQVVLEVLLEMLSAHGVDDVEVVIATSLHRRLTPVEMRRMAGERVFAALYPKRYYNHDAEDPDGMLYLGQTPHGERVNINRRCAESDLLIYVSMNSAPMGGGHKSVTVGLCDYKSLTHHHEPHTMRACDSYMDPKRSELARKIDRMGLIVDRELDVFHIELALNNRAYAGPTALFVKDEDTFAATDWARVHALKAVLGGMSQAKKRALFHSIPAPYGVVACHAGATEPVHRRILERSNTQHFVKVRGQCDILICGIPYLSPYNIDAVMNPILVQVMALGYFHNFYRGKPLLKPGGVLILTHPCPNEFDRVQHGAYREFFERVLPETRDAEVLRRKYERKFAENPSYVALYRHGHAYHGAHPFFMWYWGENGRRHVGRVIVVGAEDRRTPAVMGWEVAETLEEAIEMGRDTMGRSAEVTMLHTPPVVMADVE